MSEMTARASPEARNASVRPPTAIPKSIYTRVIIALVLVMAGYGTLFMYFTRSYADQVYELRKQELRRLVEIGLNTLQPIREEQNRGVLDNEEARNLGALLLRRLTYSDALGQNFLFMGTNRGVALVLPEQVGANRWDVQDAHGTYYIREMVAAARSGVGFVEYFAAPPGQSQPQRKIAYVVGIPEWDSWIGTEMYTLDIDGGIQVYTRNALLLTLALFLLIVAITFAALRPIARRVAIRTHELTTLLDISRSVTSTLELQPLLALILQRLKEVIDYTAATVYVIEHDELVMMGYSGPIALEKHRIRRKLQEAGPNRLSVLEGGRPVIIPDVQGETPLARAFKEHTGVHFNVVYSHLRAWMGIPLIVKGQVIGMLSFDHSQPGYYKPEHVRLALAFAQQAAAAIENARLYGQASELAALRERQRLARDLHDAVTQTLFSASLIAEVVPRLWERNIEEGRRRMEELRQLTRGALAEMRALLLELRPTALTEVNLSELLRHLTEAATGRARLPIKLTIEGMTRRLPPDTQVACYRIAQEALNNMVKYAQATQGTVYMRYNGDGILLEITDDGRGFDPANVGPDHMGLGIMRERAEAIGASLEIASTPGQGTKISLMWREEKT